MLIRTGARTVKITNNVGHTSLVTQNSRQVNGLLGVILSFREIISSYFSQYATRNAPWGKT